MVSVGAMLKQLSGMLGTDDLTEWEKDFVENVGVQSHSGTLTDRLSGKQVAVIERIWSKHFA
uniref:Uncharacterized protein n=1 Tax=viral metagenome TaxID=1070528 RepID=A0A6M3IXV9_9ZZZZ